MLLEQLHHQYTYSIHVVVEPCLSQTLKHLLHIHGRYASGFGVVQDFSKDEKRALAIESRTAPPKYGSEAKQQIINGLHARMLAAEQV